jgi:hypothetical protein
MRSGQRGSVSIGMTGRERGRLGRTGLLLPVGDVGEHWPELVGVFLSGLSLVLSWGCWVVNRRLLEDEGLDERSLILSRIVGPPDLPSVSEDCSRLEFDIFRDKVAGPFVEETGVDGRLESREKSALG